MTAEDLKMIVRRYAEEVWNQGAIDAVDRYIAGDYVRHDPGLPTEVHGPEGIERLVPMYRSAFPDIHFTAADILAEGDRVVVRWDVRGTHQGDLMGIPPTGREVRLTAIEIFRLANGKIAEQWVLVDNLGMLQQLGAFPPPAQAQA
ncbi:MAG: ester cyclase [Chloroflexota bacterium]|nr:ester cyclase [Chloroflexota bacterium]